MRMRERSAQMMTAAGEQVATDERVYHMVPTSVYDQVMQEGLKPMVGEGTRKVHPNAVPYIHALEEPEILIEAYGPHVYDNYGPFHVISAPARYFKYVEPDDNDKLPSEYKGTGAELATSISDQHIPAHELRHEWDWNSPFVQQELMGYEDNGGRPRTAAADDQRRVYHMVPDSSYDQVMSEGLKPMASDALKSVWPEAKPYIHAGPDIDTLLRQNGEWVEQSHGPFHVISAPRHYFQYADPDSVEYEGTGVEPHTYYSDQHIPANELRHEEDWDAINQLYEW